MVTMAFSSLSPPFVQLSYPNISLLHPPFPSHPVQSWSRIFFCISYYSGLLTFTHPFSLSLAHFTVHICGETEIYFAVCISLPYQAFLSLRKKNIDITFTFVCSFQSIFFCGLSRLDSENRIPPFLPLEQPWFSGKVI